MSNTGLILSYIEHRRGIETTYVVPIRGVILDEKIPTSNRTLEDVLAHDIFDFTLAWKVPKKCSGGSDTLAYRDYISC